MERVVIIGSGFAGLAAACCLARDGFSVTVLEKNDQLGGRARVWEKDGFTFDMGPSWYWMPDVFEAFFARFGKTVGDYYDLQRLDPSYRVMLAGGDALDVPAERGALEALFEAREPGSAARLGAFLDQAAEAYRVGMSDFVWRPSLRAREFADIRLLREAVRLQAFTSLRARVGKVVREPGLRQTLEFPALFLGGTAAQIPALYSLMNHADLTLGTWYPTGGMRRVVEAMVALARELGVEMVTGASVERIVVEGGRAVGVRVGGETIPAAYVLGAADYRHVEQELLPPSARAYDAAYWERRTLSPSSLLFFLGVRGRVPGLLHHNLFFDEGLDAHADAIYRDPRWPERPLFYVCAPSVTDPGVAPDGDENLFVLVPLAPGLDDGEEARERMYETVMARLEARVGQRVRERVVVKRSYAHREFVADYHAFKGNAYGLANTLGQTALFKPKLRSPKVSNLFFAGQLTAPGPGVPPALISGQIAAGLIASAARGA